MAKKWFGPFLAVCFLSFACQAIAGTSAPSQIATSSSIIEAVPLTPTSAGPAPLAAIPMAVGYGVKASWFELYFTDPTNSLGKQITGGPDQPLVTAIDAARVSVDMAAYSLSLKSVRDALLRAFKRGVAVRVVMESDNMDRTVPQPLKDAGIPMIGDRHEGLMHNKFIVIDRSEVWMGSMNFTDTGTYSDNNNLMRIRSMEIAEDYTTEFNEMFVKDKFGSDLGDPNPHPRVTLDGTPVEIYFSPDDHVQNAILPLIQNAQSSIYFLAYSFTSDPLGEAIRQRSAAGVKVSGVVEANQVASNQGTEFDPFRIAGLDVRIDGNPGQMHHKVMVIDSEVVIVGSYNFTASAEKTNDENLLIIHDSQIAAQFLQEFQRIRAVAQP